MTEISTLPPTDPDGDVATPSRDRVVRITRAELAVGAVIAAAMAVIVAIEPDIVAAPFQNARTMAFTLGGTVLAAVALVAMLRLRVPATVRIVVLVVPFVLVNWWLISPYFVDDVVDEGFATSISEQLARADDDPAAADPLPTESSATPTVAPASTAPASTESAPVAPPASAVAPAPVDTTPTTEAPTGPVLLGAGRFVGLAGHSGTGDAGIFRNPDSSLVLRFENFDIQNGPDLEVYLVPGADQVALADGSVHLGALAGNVGDQNYELPAGTELAPGAHTALVWCEAFSVEFVGATITL